jgi:pimeloyl-ACP methyl ester carboxylesterase
VLAGPVVSGLGYSFHFMERGYANFGGTDEETRARWIEDPYSVAPGNTAARARVKALLESSPQNLDSTNYRWLKSPLQPALGRLSEITAPTLIVTAEHDIPDVHAHTGAIEAGILGARRIVLDDAGHLSYLEQPAAFNHALLEFLSLISMDPGAPRTLPKPPEPWSSFSRGFVPVPGGALYYEEMGAGDPVILIHGGSIDHRMWDAQFPALAKRYRVIRYDVRGHGLSKSADTLRRNYEDLGRLMDHLRIHSAHLAGLSLGGRIVVDFAIAHPERTSSLAAVSPGISGYQFDSDEEQESRRTIVEAWQRRDWTEVAEAFLRGWTVGPRRDPEEMDQAVLERVRRMAMEGMLPGKDTGENLELDPPALGRLGEIKVPTLAVLGDEDMPGIHEIVHMIDEQVPGSHKIVFEGAAHMLNMEQPERFNRVFLEFLQGAGRP